MDAPDAYLYAMCLESANLHNARNVTWLSSTECATVMPASLWHGQLSAVLCTYLAQYVHPLG
jgi:hypothetical protein